MRGHLLQRLSIGLAILLTPAAARAEPARIIIMRHAEKLNAYALCDLGAQRGQALVSQFLGRGAAQSLFATAEKPDAILAITLHTIETVTPVAQSWNLPVIGSICDAQDGEGSRYQPSHAGSGARRSL